MLLHDAWKQHERSKEGGGLLTCHHSCPTETELLLAPSLLRPAATNRRCTAADCTPHHHCRRDSSASWQLRFVQRHIYTSHQLSQWRMATCRDRRLTLCRGDSGTGTEGPSGQRWWGCCCCVLAPTFQELGGPEATIKGTVGGLGYEGSTSSLCLAVSAAWDLSAALLYFGSRPVG